MGEFTAKALVSVIIPTYNRANIIGRTVESVIKQSYRDLEIVVVDDGSGDNTEEVIETIGDPRIRYIHHRENYGGAVARNTGIEAARGEYIAFLDSDDIWIPHKIEIQLDSIQRLPRPENVVSYTQLVWCENIQLYDLNAKVPKVGKGAIEPLADYLFCNKGVMQTSTLMLSRSLALANRFRPLKMLQDWDFCLRLEGKGAIFHFLEELLTICDMNPRRNRISNLEFRYELSLNWILEYRSSISGKATRDFILAYVLPHLDCRKKWLHAEMLILKALIQRLISFEQFRELTALVYEKIHSYSPVAEI